MVLVVALPDLALIISKLLTGARYVVRVEDGADLRRRITGHQPDVVLLDWRMGGSGWRAIDEVAAITDRTPTCPYVIALLPTVTAKIKSEAAKAGCYNVVNVGAAGGARRVVAAVIVATKARLARHLVLRRIPRNELH